MSGMIRSPEARKVWKEVAPAQWQWLHVDDNADQT